MGGTGGSGYGRNSREEMGPNRIRIHCVKFSKNCENYYADEKTMQSKAKPSLWLEHRPGMDV